MSDCDEGDVDYAGGGAPYDGLRRVTRVVQLTTGGDLRGWRLTLECGHAVEVVATGPDAAGVPETPPRCRQCAVCST